MPYVGGYFRRSPGGGKGGPPSPPRRLDVAIYGEDGALLRDRSGARYALSGLRFDSGLPGGFLSASFALKGQASNLWPGRAGLKVIIRRGARVLWWGWIEDVQRVTRGRIEEIGVTCLGPWQQAQQRLCSVDYSGTMMGDAAISNALRAYCTEISTDATQLQQTGVNIAPLSWSNEPVAKLVDLVCKAGNSSAQPMLFAVWEPSFRTGYGYPTPLNGNPHVETDSGTNYPVNWNFQTITGDPQPQWTTAIYNSPSHGLRMYRGSAAGTQVGRWFTNTDSYITVTAGQIYIFDYWLYFGAVGSISGYIRLNWFNSGGGLITQVALTTRNGSGSAGGARYVESAVAPANAAKLRIDCIGQLPDSGANSFVVWDDVYCYAPGTPVARDEKPRPHLWPRDLSGYEYLYFTALSDGLPVNVTTRELANAVIASYGTGPSYTTWAEDAESQGLYRRRDALVAAGNVSATVANATRDAHLTRHSAPNVEPGSIRIERPGALRLPHGGRVWPEDLRAGDRVRIADGPDAGRVVLLTRVEYADGVVTATAERPDDVPMLLAKVK